MIETWRHVEYVSPAFGVGSFQHSVRVRGAVVRARAVWHAAFLDVGSV